MRICEIRTKEVINMCNCRKLGRVTDLEVNLKSGCVEAIIVSEDIGFCNFFCAENCYLIPYECIKKVGEDLIFVDICEEKFTITCKKLC